MTDFTNTVLSGLVHPGIACANAYNSINNSNGFANTSTNSLIMVIIVIILAIVLWIMSLIATYRLTSSATQTVLCLFFGCIYLFFAWITYGFKGYKLIKTKT